MSCRHRRLALEGVSVKQVVSHAEPDSQVRMQVQFEHSAGEAIATKNRNRENETVNTLTGAITRILQATSDDS